ncbi:MAG: hypothetical protein WC703_04595, partial [Candidatus Neomarinimicrobiota bacterium]
MAIKSIGENSSPLWLRHLLVFSFMEMPRSIAEAMSNRTMPLDKGNGITTNNPLKQELTAFCRRTSPAKSLKGFCR